MSLLDTFNKIVAGMKDNDESNKKFASLLSSMSLQESASKQLVSSKKEPVEVEYIFRMWFDKEEHVICSG